MVDRFMVMCLTFIAELSWFHHHKAAFFMALPVFFSSSTVSPMNSLLGTTVFVPVEVFATSATAQRHPPQCWLWFHTPGLLSGIWRTTVVDTGERHGRFDVSNILSVLLSNVDIYIYMVYWVYQLIIILYMVSNYHIYFIIILYSSYMYIDSIHIYIYPPSPAALQ